LAQRELIIEYIDAENKTHPLEANTSSSDINDQFQCFVINNHLKTKGVGRNFGGKNTVSASLEVEPVILISTIPEKEVFNYSYSEQKRIFGAHGKVLPNISNFFENKQLPCSLSLASKKAKSSSSEPRIECLVEISL
jgi:hypothetical protein